MLVYRILVTLYGLALLPSAILKGQLLERLGLIAPKHKGPHIWLHGASMGEINSSKALVRRLTGERPDLKWLITSNTLAGCQAAKGLSVPNAQVELAPFDWAFCLRRMNRRFQFTAHITLETEIWPNRIRLSGPVQILIGGRMSRSSAKAYSYLHKLARRTLARFDLISTQDRNSKARLETLGARKDVMLGVLNLKQFFDSAAPDVPSAYAKAFPRPQTWLAASTHEGEEEIVLQAHKAALAANANLQLILAPRHPARAGDIGKVLDAMALSYTQRSAGQAPKAGAVYLADTVQEMPLWYAMAGQVFVGGSLTDRGGHTPFEPAAFGACVIHGPDTRNFAAAYKALHKANGAIEVSDAKALTAALIACADDSAQTEYGRKAQIALAPEASIDALVSAILDKLAH